MITNRLLTIYLLLLLAISSLTMATTTASVDKTEIVYGETFNLTLATDSADTPDLEPIKNLFNILGMQQSEQVTYTNGKTTASKQWIITLEPKTQTKGGIVIPPINVGKEQTKPITIKIIDTPKTITAVNGKDILKTEISLEKPTAYIQQQLILTLHIYASDKVVRLNKLIEPTITDINIKPLKNNNYTREINGISYTIIERRYAISPQKSGKLKIPSFALSALISENNQTVNKTVVSNELTLTVKPKPANYPANTPWLPAKNLTLNEKWDKTPNKVLQGDTLTRTLTLTAEGLTSNQIGTIPTTSITGIRSYPDQPKLKDSWLENTPTGVREQHEVLIPIQTGDIIIPEIKIAWWNTDKDQLEYATVAEHKIQVTANPAFNNTAHTTTNTNSQPPTIIKKVVSPSLWLWQLSTALLTMTTLIGFALWLHARRQPAIIKELAPVINPKTLLDDIKRACQDKDPQACRQALDNWVKQQPENLTEMVARYAPLAEAVEALNKALYSEAGQEWQGNKLWQVIQQLPKKEITSDNTNNSLLPPLYPK